MIVITVWCTGIYYIYLVYYIYRLLQKISDSSEQTTYTEYVYIIYWVCGCLLIISSNSSFATGHLNCKHDVVLPAVQLVSANGTIAETRNSLASFLQTSSLKKQ